MKIIIKLQFSQNNINQSQNKIIIIIIFYLLGTSFIFSENKIYKQSSHLL